MSSGIKPLLYLGADRQRQLAGSGYGVVAFASKDGEAFTTHADFNSVVILGFVVATGIVAQSVLVTGLFGNAGVEIFEGIAFRGVEDIAASIVGVRLETGEFALVEAAADSKAVNGNSVAEKLFNGVVVGVVIALAVFTVGDQKNYFAAVAAAILQELRSLVDSVVEGFGRFLANHHG